MIERMFPAAGCFSEEFGPLPEPRAWAWRDEPSGKEVYSGREDPRPTHKSEPLYDQASLDAAVAAERKRISEHLRRAGEQAVGEEGVAIEWAAEEVLRV